MRKSLSRFDIWLRQRAEKRYGPITEWRLYNWLRSERSNWLFTALAFVLNVWDNRLLRYSVSANVALASGLIACIVSWD